MKNVKSKNAVRKTDIDLEIFNKLIKRSVIIDVRSLNNLLYRK